MAPAAAIAEELVGAILRDLAPRPGQPLLLLVNGFGGTPLLELYVMFDATARLLSAAGLTIARSLVGNYVTSLEMAGCSLTVARLDDELLRLWDAPVHTAALRWGR
jgi:dihydroxyacetone kinase-like protein